eukprot:7099886-Ditylum_brightwellii.AAC.1
MDNKKVVEIQQQKVKSPLKGWRVVQIHGLYPCLSWKCQHKLLFHPFIITGHYCYNLISNTATFKTDNPSIVRLLFNNAARPNYMTMSNPSSIDNIGQALGCGFNYVMNQATLLATKDVSTLHRKWEGKMDKTKLTLEIGTGRAQQVCTS